VREIISSILKDFEIEGLVKMDRNPVQTVDQEALKKLPNFGESSH
jgi:hypothetical protein